ncbi:Smr/MutS family protein [Mycoplasma sp. 1018B]|uniref:Smr/MutS family protein n=1 Tax=Mycoplasma sp. 1018B TaxID=2967302 RepID=UPI00211CC4B9|nr:Smr/MutS family protein [Mycoplasma sp. 1018B]UUM19447.1 Smr/MutS family protein [Mycoplasma sp. 1018B]
MKIDNYHQALDLHHLNQAQAVSQISLALLEAKETNKNKLYIITGKGKKVLQNTLDNVLLENNLEYALYNQGGVYEIQIPSNNNQKLNLNIEDAFNLWKNLDQESQEDLLNYIDEEFN